MNFKLSSVDTCYCEADCPAENEVFNKVNTILIDNFNFVSENYYNYYSNLDIWFNGKKLEFDEVNCVYETEGDKDKSYQLFRYSNNLGYVINGYRIVEYVSIKQYDNENIPVEIEVSADILVEEFDEEETFFFEHEGMKTADMSFSKGECMDNYKLILQVN
jgi:hypothetical protein